MEMIKTHSGKLRAIGYDAGKRVLRVELEEGSLLEYLNITDSLWRHLKNASAQWSYYRDNIEEEFTAHRVSSKPSCAGKNPLDDLFST